MASTLTVVVFISPVITLVCAAAETAISPNSAAALHVIALLMSSSSNATDRPVRSTPCRQLQRQPLLALFASSILDRTGSDRRQTSGTPERTPGCRPRAAHDVSRCSLT